MNLTAVRILTALAILGPAACILVWGLGAKFSCCTQCKKKCKKDKISPEAVEEKHGCGCECDGHEKSHKSSPCDEEKDT